jgi:hypothetical protein
MRSAARFTLSPRTWAVFLTAAAVTSLGFLSFCDLFYGCGCRAPWAGAADFCNIHVPGVRHCPWCSYGYLGGAIPYGAILIAQALVAFWPAALSLWLRLAGALIAFPVVGGVVAVIFGWLSGYWD